MSRIVAALRRHAVTSPGKVALQDESGSLTYDQLWPAISRLSERLQGGAAPQAIALHCDNGRDWLLADLAAQVAGIPMIPLPLFFSAAQIDHALKTAGVDQLITDQPERLLAALQLTGVSAEPLHGDLQRIRLPAPGRVPLPKGTSKVTFTSGTTGAPKGVCLSREAMETVAESLASASAASADDRHLCLLPLATLLENIGGIYVPLLAGATICLPRLASVGLAGSSGLDVGRLIAALGDWQASTAIMVPQMLQAMVAAAQSGVRLPRGLRYLAVGGAPVSSQLLENAKALGLPIYEGYGLSECASVVAVNRPGESRSGSVGKLLPHVRIDFAEDGEILVGAAHWLGYLGDRAQPWAGDLFATGDLGYLDEEGYLFITGRKKNIFITSFGRNVAPEWVEGELLAQAGIAQAAIFGEARPFNSAVIVAQRGTPPAAIDAALRQANRLLPDYARVRAWVPASEPFTLGNGMATANGRLKRNEIFGKYAFQIDALYPD